MANWQYALICARNRATGSSAGTDSSAARICLPSNS